MSTGWENYEPAPLEFFHGRLLNLFHEYRTKNSDGTFVSIDGTTLVNLIAKAKLETYAKYPKQINSNAILKSEI